MKFHPRPDWEGGFKGAVIALGLMDIGIWYAGWMVGPLFPFHGLYPFIALPSWLLANKEYFGAAGLLEFIASIGSAVLIVRQYGYSSVSFNALCLVSLPRLFLGLAGIMLDKRFANSFVKIAGTK